MNDMPWYDDKDEIIAFFSSDEYQGFVQKQQTAIASVFNGVADLCLQNIVNALSSFAHQPVSIRQLAAIPEKHIKKPQPRFTFADCKRESPLPKLFLFVESVALKLRPIFLNPSVKALAPTQAL